MKDIPLRIKRLAHGEGLPLPFYATPGSSGMDLSAAVQEDVILAPGERRLIPTGFAISVPRGFEVQARPRSGLALRHGISMPNTPGTIDSDYRGEISVILINHGTESFTISRGDRIAQIVVVPVVQAAITEVDDLDDTDRGAGGFGSTGV